MVPAKKRKIIVKITKNPRNHEQICKECKSFSKIFLWNALMSTQATSKLSKTAHWLTQKDEQSQNEIIWRSLRARKESKINRDSEKRNEVLKFLRFPVNAGECIMQKPCE